MKTISMVMMLGLGAMAFTSSALASPYNKAACPHTFTSHASTTTVQRAATPTQQAAPRRSGFMYENHGTWRNVYYDGKYVSTDHLSDFGNRKVWVSNQSGNQYPY